MTRREHMIAGLVAALALGGGSALIKQEVDARDARPAPVLARATLLAAGVTDAEILDMEIDIDMRNTPHLDRRPYTRAVCFVSPAAEVVALRSKLLALLCAEGDAQCLADNAEMIWRPLGPTPSGPVTHFWDCARVTEAMFAVGSRLFPPGSSYAHHLDARAAFEGAGLVEVTE